MLNFERARSLQLQVLTDLEQSQALRWYPEAAELHKEEAAYEMVQLYREFIHSNPHPPLLYKHHLW